MSTRVYRPKWLKRLRAIVTGKPIRRKARRKAKKLFGTRTHRPRKPIQNRQRPNGITPGRTFIEWLTHPELGRGRVIQQLPGNYLDVEFETGGRPPSGVPLEEVAILTK